MKRQEYPWSCGSAAVRNAFRFYGHKVPENQIRALAGTTKEDGTDEKGVISAVRGFGYRCIEYTANSPMQAWAWLSGSLLSGIPVILCIENWEHWVVALSVAGDRITIFDSSNFKKVVNESNTFVWTRRTLMKKWRNGRKSVEGPRFYAIAVGK